MLRIRALHPGEEQLLRFADGELRPERRRTCGPIWRRAGAAGPSWRGCSAPLATTSATTRAGQYPNHPGPGPTFGCGWRDSTSRGPWRRGARRIAGWPPQRGTAGLPGGLAVRTASRGKRRRAASPVGGRRGFGPAAAPADPGAYAEPLFHPAGSRNRGERDRRRPGGSLVRRRALQLEDR